MTQWNLTSSFSGLSQTVFADLAGGQRLGRGLGKKRQGQKVLYHKGLRGGGRGGKEAFELE